MKNRGFRLFLLAAPFLFSNFAAGKTVKANVYTSISPNELLEILDSEKGTAKLNTSGEDTTLAGRVESVNYAVFFYQCDGGDMASLAKPNSQCLGYEFRAYFTGEYTQDVEVVNAYNAAEHYGLLWLDKDGDLALQLNVIVEGGITLENIRATFTWWRVVLGSFENYMKDH